MGKLFLNYLIQRLLIIICTYRNYLSLNSSVVAPNTFIVAESFSQTLIITQDRSLLELNGVISEKVENLCQT